MKFFSLMSVLMPVCRLDDQVIAACGSANVGASPVLSSTGGPSEMIATQPVPGQRHVVEATAHHPADALDAPDVPLDARVEREQVGAVDGDGVVLEVDQMDVLGLIGEEDLARSRPSSSASCPRP